MPAGQIIFIGYYFFGMYDWKTLVSGSTFPTNAEFDLLATVKNTGAERISANVKGFVLAPEAEFEENVPPITSTFRAINPGEEFGVGFRYNLHQPGTYSFRFELTDYLTLLDIQEIDIIGSRPAEPGEIPAELVKEPGRFPIVPFLVALSGLGIMIAKRRR